MKTIELVKSRIESLDRKVNSYKEIQVAAPVMKRQIVNGKMEWILQNPESSKWAVISTEEVDELNNMYNIAQYGVSADNDPFAFKA